MKSNLIAWIESEAAGETIEAVVIGEKGWSSDDNPVPKEHQNKILSWNQAKLLLDYDFDSGFGAPGCNAIYAWTKSWIIAVSQYDGATGSFRIPRNPVDCTPEMPGG